MKAVVIDEFGGVDVLKLKEVDIPVPSSSEVIAYLLLLNINTEY